MASSYLVKQNGVTRQAKKGAAPKQVVLDDVDQSDEDDGFDDMEEIPLETTQAFDVEPAPVQPAPKVICYFTNTLNCGLVSTHEKNF